MSVVTETRLIKSHPKNTTTEIGGMAEQIVPCLLARSLSSGPPSPVDVGINEINQKSVLKNIKRQRIL